LELESGKELLHYRLVEQIGEGGMGVVWKALDTDLGREVAIKVLPAAFADDADRLTRFEREARLLASLNHPGIAAIYGLHQVDGLRFLAMELISGEDLSDRLKRGALPVDEALGLTVQICESFATAHDAGVIHRDLKPANVMLTTEGKVKVLDFGLAKALTADPVSGSNSASMSPTMTSAGTQLGMILGTAAYMSPEQARGQQVDRRADIWALGCLLYEMLTGKAVFGGETVTDTMAAVVRGAPNWSLLPSQTPTQVRRVLRRTLEKDPTRRLRDAGDLRLEMEDALASPEEAEAVVGTAAAAPKSGRRTVLRAALFTLAGAALTLIAMQFRPTSTVTPEITHPARFELIAATEPASLDANVMTVSPDGSRIAWVVAEGSRTSIFMREIDEIKAQKLPDTEGASRPRFSPDGRSIAFYAGGKIRRYDLGARQAIDLCDAVNGAGIGWGTDGTIVFNSGWISGLTRVSADGGTPEPVSELDPEDGEIGHWFPDVLPGDRHVLVSRWRTGLNDISVAIVSLETGKATDLIPRASFARFVAPNRIMFTRSGAIYSVPFDPDRRELSGSPVLVVDGVDQEWASGASPWTVAQNGVLAYLPGGLWQTKRNIVSASRDGSVETFDIEAGAYQSVSMSPDGKKLALTEFKNGRTNVLIHDLERGVDRRLPSDDLNTWPVWGPDSREIIFDTSRNGPWDLFRASIEGGREPQPVLLNSEDKIPLDWSSDGKILIYQEAYEELRMLDLTGDGTPVTFDTEHGSTDRLELSPDARWIVYSSSNSGQSDIFVRRFPDGTSDYQVSVGGGDSPIWTSKGDEILYRSGDAVLSVRLTITGDRVVASPPQELFRGNFIHDDERLQWSYDAVRDRMILIETGTAEKSRDRFVVSLSGLP
jgi:serine/threonine-protein kinase